VDVVREIVRQLNPGVDVTDAEIVAHLRALADEIERESGERP
jgi:hypothetical protein